MKRIVRTTTLVLLASLFLGACGGVPTVVPAETPAGLTLTDALGRSVVFDTPPQRIVIAGKSSLTIVDTLYLFPETSQRLVGLVVGKQPIGDFVSLVDPTWDQKAILAVDAGPEQIAPLQPDAVLLRSFMAESLGRPLEILGIPVVYLDLETPEQYFRDITVLGQLLDNEPRAREIETFYQSRLDEVAQAVVSADQKPRVLLVQYSDQGGEVALNVPSVSWLQTTEVELAGGTPVWSEAAQGGGWTVVNFEQIAAWDPDKIFVIHYDADSAEVVEMLQADVKWQALTAVQRGQIYGFPTDIFSWDQPDPRWILGVTWLASKIHPGALAEIDMQQEAIQFFRQMYGLEEAAVQTQILPRLKGNVQ
jgi:iron complex transport system substrate-binding protein